MLYKIYYMFLLFISINYYQCDIYEQKFKAKLYRC